MKKLSPGQALPTSRPRVRKRQHTEGGAAGCQSLPGLLRELRPSALPSAPSVSQCSLQGHSPTLNCP